MDWPELPWTQIEGDTLTYTRKDRPDMPSEDKAQDDGVIRTFEGGATRDTSEDKLDYEAILCPRALRRYVMYMHSNRKQSDGSMRAGDNWQKGMPVGVYMKSRFRHFMDSWLLHRGYREEATTEDQIEAVCGELFNAFGLLHELLKKEDEKPEEKLGAQSVGPVSLLPKKPFLNTEVVLKEATDKLVHEVKESLSLRMKSRGPRICPDCTEELTCERSKYHVLDCKYFTFKGCDLCEWTTCNVKHSSNTRCMRGGLKWADDIDPFRKARAANDAAHAAGEKISEDLHKNHGVGISCKDCQKVVDCSVSSSETKVCMDHQRELKALNITLEGESTRGICGIKYCIYGDGCQHLDDYYECSMYSSRLIAARIRLKIRDGVIDRLNGTPEQKINAALTPRRVKEMTDRAKEKDRNLDNICYHCVKQNDCRRKNSHVITCSRFDDIQGRVHCNLCERWVKCPRKTQVPKDCVDYRWNRGRTPSDLLKETL